jgi:hypothetical protein
MQIAPVKGRMRPVEELEVRRAVIATQPLGAVEYPFAYFSLI